MSEITQEIINQFLTLRNILEEKAEKIIEEYNKEHNTDFDLDYIDEEGIWATQYLCGEGETIKLPLEELLEENKMYLVLTDNYNKKILVNMDNILTIEEDKSLYTDGTQYLKLIPNSKDRDVIFIKEAKEEIIEMLKQQDKGSQELEKLLSKFQNMTVDEYEKEYEKLLPITSNTSLSREEIALSILNGKFASGHTNFLIYEDYIEFIQEAFVLADIFIKEREKKDC